MENLPQTDTLAQEIQRHHDEAQRCAGEAVEHARQAGEALLKAKSEIGHGNWLPWFEKAGFSFAERTAQAYMRLAKEWPGLPEQKRNAVADLSLRDAMKALAKPAKADKPVKAVTKPSSRPKADPVKVYDKAAAMLPEMDARGLSDLAYRCIDLMARAGTDAAHRELRRIGGRANDKATEIFMALEQKARPKKAAAKKPANVWSVSGDGDDQTYHVRIEP